MNPLIILLVSFLFYIMGVSVSYISTVLYFYYTSTDRKDKERSLEEAKEDILRYFETNAIFSLSWIFFFVSLIYALGIFIVWANGKIIKFVITHIN